MVKIRRAIETLYDSICDIVVLKEVEKPNGSSADEEIAICRKEPCRLSYQSFPQATDPAPAAAVSQVIKLFIAPEVLVPPGSQIIITEKRGRKERYSSSGKPAIYETHQEIILHYEKGAI